MTAVIGGLALMVLVVGLPAALLWMSDRLRRRRRDAIAKQIAVTDAIHREVGALVAPFVTKAWDGAWEVRVAVPFSRPAIVTRVLSAATAVLGSAPSRRGVRFVLTAQAPARLLPALGGLPALSTMSRGSANGIEHRTRPGLERVA